MHLVIVGDDVNITLTLAEWKYWKESLSSTVFQLLREGEMASIAVHDQITDTSAV